MNSRSTNDEQNELILNNINLVHYLVNNLGINQLSPEYEDMVSIGKIGLIKAANSFDESKGIKFATYAARCITNEIFMSFRKANKYANDVSLDEPVGRDDEGHEITVGDKIQAPNSNFAEAIANKDVFCKIISIILNVLESRERLFVLYKLSGYTQAEIGEKLKISQSYVSRLEPKIGKKIKSYLASNKQIKEVYSMKVAEDLYEIAFMAKDISLFNVIFEKLTFNGNMPDFVLRCIKERVYIKMAPDPKSFNFIAEIIKVLDDFKLTYVSNNKSLTGETAVIEDDVVVETIGESELSAIVHDGKGENISEENTPEDSIIENDSNISELNKSDKVEESPKKRQRNGYSKMVRDYILGLDCFTVKELTTHFPEVSYAIINNVIQREKEAGTIEPKDRGTYQVIKN